VLTRTPGPGPAAVAEAAPFSILFPDPEAVPPASGRGWPTEVTDLNLDQVFDAIAESRREYALAPFLGAPLPDAASVAYRQAVFADLESGLAPPIEEFAARMRTLRSHLAAAAQRRHRYERASWFLGAGRVYCEALTALGDALDAAAPASEGLRRCRAYLTGLAGGSEFAGLRAETARLTRELGDLRYCVRWDGGRVSVSNYRDEPDYSAEVLATFEKFRVAEAQPHLVTFRHDFQNHVQEQIVDRLALLHPDLFRALLEYADRYAHLVDPLISRFDREVQLYLGYLSYVEPLRGAGLPFCHPEIDGASREVSARDTFDLALASKLVAEGRPVVLNDIQLGGPERIAVVSGPNQGGKTTFARTFGQLHHLAALGFPTPGTGARLPLADRVLTHFARPEQVEDLHSGLEAELLRVREMLAAASPRSVMVMNESFAGTTSDDQLFLGREVIGRLIDMDALAVYVTFIDELSRLGPSVVSMMSTVVAENPEQRTFKVVRQPADGRAHAMVLARAHRLSYEAITERVRP
jgi:DNA mismatch repair protein MutS